MIDFDTIYKTHYRYLTVVAARICSDRQKSEELVIDTFVEYWKNKDRVSGHLYEIRNYMLTILKRKAIDFYRSRKSGKRPPVFLINNYSALEDTYEERPYNSDYYFDMLVDAIRLLTRQQQIIIIMLLQGKHSRQICERLGIRQQTFLNTKHTAFCRLREIFGIVPKFKGAKGRRVLQPPLIKKAAVCQ